MKIEKILNKMMTRRMNTLKTMLQPSNLPKLFSLFVLLGVLYYVYVTYLKEGYKNMDPDNKYEIDPDEFDKNIIQGSGKKLVLFYAGWCGHCTQLKPTWDKAAEKINTGSDSKSWKIWKINVGGNESPNDATSEQEALGKKYKVKGYPTIYLFENGKMVTEYEGPRTEEGFMQILS